MKKLFTFILAIAVIITGAFIVSAEGESLTLQDMTPEEQNHFLSAIKLTLQTDEPKKNIVECFDVSPSGLLAVGTDVDSQLVSIYDLDGNFKYSYSFDCSGVFYVKWDNDNLMIYFVRSDVIASFDKDGNCLYVKEIADTTNEDYLRHEFIMADQRSVNGNTYEMKKLSIINFFTSYGTIEEVNADGVKRIIYRTDKEHFIRVITEAAVILLFFAFVFLCVKLEKKNKKPD